MVLRGLRDERDSSVDDLGEVVRRDVRRHAYCNTGRSINNQVRDAGREDSGFEGRLVVVRSEVDGVGVDVGKHLPGDAGKARLGVAHGGGWIAVDGAKVSLAIDHGVAEREGLGQADHGVVDRRVAVRMIVAHHVAHNLG